MCTLSCGEPEQLRYENNGLRKTWTQDKRQRQKEIKIWKIQKKQSPADIILSRLRKDSDGKYTNVFKTLSDSRILKLAYETIKSKPGNMVRGTTRETLDGISVEWFEKTSRKLRSESLKLRPNRRVYIPKANGKLRPLGIASPRDKVIQQAMNMVMETVLEPKFHNSSHGFRPKRGCHTALQEIRSWKGVPWIIEGDIKSFFDSIDHHVLERLLAKHFRERRLFNLYWKLVKAWLSWVRQKKENSSPPMSGSLKVV